MTGYGRATLETPIGRFSAEISSVNRKFLDIEVNLPHELSRFESDVKKLLGEKIARGQIKAKIFVNFENVTPINIKPNLSFVRQLKAAWETISRDLKLKPEESIFSLSAIANREDLFIFEESDTVVEAYRTPLLEVLNQALDIFLQMRMKEGENLQKDILNRLQSIKTNIKKIEELASEVTERLRQKLKNRLQEAFSEIQVDEERLMKEVFFYAEKMDITEEVMRFNSHLDQLNSLIHSSTSAIGKTFEFLLQELGREINTIGSKAADIHISKLVIEVKGQLEKMREQIQNIE